MTEPVDAGGLPGYAVDGCGPGFTELPPFDMDLLNRVMAKYSALPPPEPLRLTREQWDEVKALLGPPVSGTAPLSSVPVYIVDRVEDSTPYRRRLEKLRATADDAMSVPFPDFTFQATPAARHSQTAES